MRRDPDGLLAELRCRGHAAFGEPGQDLVCAGVSAVVGMLALGLSEAARLPVKLQAGDGHFRVRRPVDLTETELDRWKVLMEAAVAALRQLEEHYRGFVRVRMQVAGRGAQKEKDAARRPDRPGRTER